MNLVSKKLFLVAASAVCAFLAGCPKPLVRPDPGSTVMGPQTGGPNIDRNLPTDLIAGNGPTDLVAKGPNDIIDDGRTIRNQFGAASQVFFDFDRSEIKQSERAKFPAVKAYLEANPGSRVLFEGYCDWRGTAEYNLALGDRRANAAKRYAQSLGIPANRVEVSSKGSLEAAKNADDTQMAKDRRAEIIIVKANPTATPL